MIVNGRFIGRSLVCFVVFGLGLLASDPKCFKQTGDKTVLKRDCKGSEVLTVNSQELMVYFKSSRLVKDEQKFVFTIGGCKIKAKYGSFGTQAAIQYEDIIYNLPANMTFMPEDTWVRCNKLAYEFECSSKFEEDGKPYKIKVDYAPDHPEKLGSLTATFDAIIFVGEEDNTKAKIMWAAIAALVVLVVIIIILVVIYCCCVKNKKSKKSNQPLQSTPAAVLTSWKLNQPQFYDAPMQPIVEQVKPVEKKEELMVKEKLDEEKEKEVCQKHRVRLPQTISVDNPSQTIQVAKGFWSVSTDCSFQQQCLLNNNNKLMSISLTIKCHRDFHKQLDVCFKKMEKRI
ncbi:hypothetical protein M3Y95_01280000 [Aphelenchoides besseyi]|nr:hypothetical protein M3Y95_01280000 [Aphelenchoides besseyi]